MLLSFEIADRAIIIEPSYYNFWLIENPQLLRRLPGQVSGKTAGRPASAAAAGGQQGISCLSRKYLVSIKTICNKVSSQRSAPHSIRASMRPGLRSHAAEDASSSRPTTPSTAEATLSGAAADVSGSPVLRPVATANSAVGSDAFLVDSPGPGSPQVLGSFAFGAQYYNNRPSTADTSGIG